MAENQTFPGVGKVEYGQRGTVVGPATNERVKGKGVDVQFPGNKGTVSCFFTDVRRTPISPSRCGVGARGGGGGVCSPLHSLSPCVRS